MAVKGMIFGNKVVMKESGGRYFLSRAVPWTDAPGKAPEAVKRRNEAFKSAVPGCRSESKYKGGNVWGVSKFNKCLGEALK